MSQECQAVVGTVLQSKKNEIIKLEEKISAHHSLKTCTVPPDNNCQTLTVRAVPPEISVGKSTRRNSRQETGRARQGVEPVGENNQSGSKSMQCRKYL